MPTELPASLGNDIVDLESEDTITHPGFDKRVYTNNELEFISNSKELKWLFWTVKESAYKTLKRIKPKITFIPSKFEFNFADKVVSYENINIPCNWNITNESVYAYCYTQACQKLHHWIDTNNELDQATNAIRNLAKSKVANLLKIPVEQIEIKDHILSEQDLHSKKTNYYPEVWINGKPSELQISFSHHGRYLAVLVAL